MKIYLYILLGIIAFITLFSSCDDSDDNNVKAINIKVTNAVYEIGDVSAITLKDNQPLQLETFIMPTNATDKSVTYELWGKGKGVFEITPGGLLTSLVFTPETGEIPIPLGVDTIVVRANDGSGAFVKYPVRVHSHIMVATSISVKSTGQNAQIQNGQTFNLAEQITVNPEEASDKTVSYKSSDETIATVDANGIITGVGEVGQTTTITITSNDRGKVSTQSNVIIVAESPLYLELANSTWILSSNLGVKEGSLANLLDDNNATFWAPEILKRPIYSPACWLDIDMGEVKKIGQLGYRHRALNYSHLQCHTFTIQAKKAEGDAWTDIKECVTEPLKSDINQLFEFASTEVRFIRINFIKGHLRAGKTDWDYSEDGNVSVGDLKLYLYNR